jgi:hypothetical protein
MICPSMFALAKRKYNIFVQARYGTKDQGDTPVALGKIRGWRGKTGSRAG